MTTSATLGMQAAGALLALKSFIGIGQRKALHQLIKGEEGDYYANMLIALEKQIAEMPHSYQTDGQGEQAIVQLHYFRGSTDAWITEKDAGDNETECQGRGPRQCPLVDDCGCAGKGQHQAFGLIDIGYGSELGYINIEELTAAGVELDLHWTPKTLGELKREREAAEAAAIEARRRSLGLAVSELEGIDSDPNLEGHQGAAGWASVVA